jgi:hypothetical protein
MMTEQNRVTTYSPLITTDRLFLLVYSLYAVNRQREARRLHIPVYLDQQLFLDLEPLSFTNSSAAVENCIQW